MMNSSSIWWFLCGALAGWLAAWLLSALFESRTKIFAAQRHAGWVSDDERRSQKEGRA
jgi:uncharacterized membrane protein YeaQ/YmgE (transglycosylase-associated protein family)